MAGIGHAGYSFVQSMTGNPLVDSAMVYAAEYLVFLIPLALAYLWFRDRGAKKDSLFAFYATVGGILSTYVLGLLYYHQPPHLQGFETILMNEPENAFPSQHAAAAFSVVWPLIYRGREEIGYILLAGAVLTGFARVYTGLHFPVDIAGGIIASLLSFSVFYLIEERVEELSGRVVGFYEGSMRKLGLENLT